VKSMGKEKMMKVEIVSIIMVACSLLGCMTGQRNGPLAFDDQEAVVGRMLKTDDVRKWEEGVEQVTDEKLLADIAIAAHPFCEDNGKIKQSVLPAGLKAVDKLTKKAYIEKVYESARSNEVRDAAKAKR